MVWGSGQHVRWKRAWAKIRITKDGAKTARKFRKRWEPSDTALTTLAVR